jgi:hypothetical protein
MSGGYRVRQWRNYRKWLGVLDNPDIFEFLAIL